jgi:ribonuclease VapC
VIVLDTSAIVAILQREPEAALFAEIIETTPRCLISAGTYLELGIVAEQLRNVVGRADAERFVRDAEIEIVPFDTEQAELALAAFRHFGKGRHQARLNFGDCFAYALAKSLDAPLLFKGNDFGKTDIRHTSP